jgi:hypothetical protein
MPSWGCLSFVGLAAFSGAVVGLIVITAALEAIDRAVRWRQRREDRP